MARARLDSREENNEDDDVRFGGRDDHGLADDVGLWRRSASPSDDSHHATTTSATSAGATAPATSAGSTDSV